eukprot:10703580-Prorocentrum_lima.AAC.1
MDHSQSDLRKRRHNLLWKIAPGIITCKKEIVTETIARVTTKINSVSSTYNISWNGWNGQEESSTPLDMLPLIDHVLQHPMGAS